MAHDKSIDELERDVEQARARVAADISMLRAPETFDDAKHRLTASVFGYRDQLRDHAAGYGNGMMETLKAKAAANPLAVAAIGAGIAWRLYKHPPVTTALVGLGLASLLRTDPDDDSMHPRKLMEAASEKAIAFKDRAATQVTELRENAVGAIEEKMHEWTAAAEGAYEAAAERVSAMASSAGDSAQAAFDKTRDPEALGVRAHAMRSPTADIPYQSDEPRSSNGGVSNAIRAWSNGGVGERRDAYLLGLAALAVGAAVGLARMRSSDDSDEDMDERLDERLDYDAYDDDREIT